MGCCTVANITFGHEPLFSAWLNKLLAENIGPEAHFLVIASPINVSAGSGLQIYDGNEPIALLRNVGLDETERFVRELGKRRNGK